MPDQQGQHLAVEWLDVLRLMPPRGQREVHGKDGVGVDQQLQLRACWRVLQLMAELLLGAVLGAEEAGALADGLLGDGSPRGAHAGWVILRHQRHLSQLQLFRLYVGQFPVALQRFGPEPELAVEKALQRRALLLALAVFFLVHSLPGLYLQRAEAVLVQVVLVHALNAQCGVAVAVPSAAKVQLVEDAANAVAS